MANDFSARAGVVLGAAFLLLTAVVASILPTPSSAAGERPNVLIIVSDDQRASGTIDDAVIDTIMPRTKAWFRDGGRKYDNAYVTTPLCCPSRSSILSGRYAHNHGVLANGAADTSSPRSQRTGMANFDQTLSLERYLQRAGYKTGVFGKFLNGWRIPSVGETGSAPLAVRQNPLFWDRWAITPGHAHYSCLYSAPGHCLIPVNRNGTMEGIPAGPPDDRKAVPAKYAADYFADRAKEFIQETETSGTDPWFAYIAPNEPHGPYDSKRMYETLDVGAPTITEAHHEGEPGHDSISDKPPWVQAATPFDDVFKTDGTGVRENQLRMLRSVDDLVETVLSEVEDPNNTLAIYIGDNGFQWNEHRLYGKSVPYKESVKVPFFVRWPDGNFMGGQVDSSRIVANIDIAPTILEAAGLSPDVPMDGESLSQPSSRTRILLEHEPLGSFPRWASFRSNGYQYVEWYPADYCQRPVGDPDRKPSFREYYLASDQPQLTNTLGSSGNPPDPALPSDLAAARQECQPPDPPLARLADFESAGSAQFGFDRVEGSVTRVPSALNLNDPIQSLIGARLQSWVGQAHYTPGQTGPSSGAFDAFAPNDGELFYSGWFFLPSNFQTAQESDLVLMQWDNARSFMPPTHRDYGGIVIPKPAPGQNPQIRLFKKTGDNPRQIIGSSLPTVNAPGGKWFFVWVWQILGDGVRQSTPSIPDPVDRPKNYVWYSDGETPEWILYNHDEPNAITGGRALAADRVRYGAIDYSGTNPLDVRFDCASIYRLCP